jgi:hypothetical protein
MKGDTMLRKLTRDDVEISVEALPEDMHPGDSFGLDDPEEQKIVDNIIERAESNIWAWCCIRVRVTWRGHAGTAYLGGCSYESKEDFIKQDDYYPDMVDEALADLNRELKALYEELDELAITSSVQRSTGEIV